MDGRDEAELERLAIALFVDKGERHARRLQLQRMARAADADVIGGVPFNAKFFAACDVDAKEARAAETVACGLPPGELDSEATILRDCRSRKARIAAMRARISGVSSLN